MLLHLCEQSFSDMIGNTNEPSTRVRVSNLGGGDAMKQVFALERDCFYMFTFPLGSSYKDIVDLIESAISLTSVSSSLIIS